MSESTPWTTPGVAAAYYSQDYPGVLGVSAAYYNNENFPGIPGAAAAAYDYSYNYSEDYLSAPGVRFAPTDQELIVKYLQRKLRGEPLPTDVVRDGHDAYAEHPKKLVLKLGEGIEGSWYLFSKRLRKYAGGMRPKRAMSNDDGHWKATGRETVVHDGGEEEEVIGARRSLTFHEDTYEKGSHGRLRRVKGRLASRPTKWKMTEFVCSKSCRPPAGGGNAAAAADPMVLNDFVLCKITDKSDDDEENLPDELQQAGGGGAGGTQAEAEAETEADQQQQGSPGGGAASQEHGNQQPAPAEAPLDDYAYDYGLPDISNPDCRIPDFVNW